LRRAYDYWQNQPGCYPLFHVPCHAPLRVRSQKHGLPPPSPLPQVKRQPTFPGGRVAFVHSHRTTIVRQADPSAFDASKDIPKLTFPTSYPAPSRHQVALPAKHSHKAQFKCTLVRYCRIRHTIARQFALIYCYAERTSKPTSPWGKQGITPTHPQQRHAEQAPPLIDPSHLPGTLHQTLAHPSQPPA